MSIYQPSLLSGITSTAGGVLSSVVGGASSGLGAAASNALGSRFGGLGGTVAGNLANAAINMGATEINRRANALIQRVGYDLDNQLNNAAQSTLSALGLSSFGNNSVKEKDLYFAGGLSLNDMKQIIEETNADDLSRKNFYVLQVNDRSMRAPTDGNDTHLSVFNLFTTNLSFNPFEITGEQIQIGASTMNIPNQSGLTEMSLTLIDNRAGIIKDWAKQKHLLQTPNDGTVMPPYYHCFDVRVIYGTNKAYKGYYNETYSMMITGIQTDLGRDSDNELERVQLRFTQESTFMPPWL